jgi:hypothetical protein
MLDIWLKGAQWVTSQFGLPGSIMVGLTLYLMYTLREERAKIDVLQDKRLELHTTYLKSLSDLKDALEALASKVGK